MTGRDRIIRAGAVAIGLAILPWGLPSSGSPPRAPGTSRSDPRGIVQVWVPAGSFLMGTADTAGLTPPRWAKAELVSEMPAHRVALTRGYWIDRHEVTRSAFRAFVEDGGYTNPGWWSEEGRGWLAGRDPAALPVECMEHAGDDEPRVCVTWYEAEAYARWRGGRLPTEAEWEFAARGPQARVYPWGNAFDSTRAVIVGVDRPAPVGTRPGGASWVGALDMSGNAMEWVSDWLDVAYYARGDSVDPRGPATGRIKIEKGGWWGGPVFAARSSYRHFEDPPEYQDHHIGFRVVTPE